MCYDFSISPSLNRVLKPSFSKVVRKEPVTVVEWNMAFPKEDFEQSLDEGEVDAAWKILCETANKLLTSLSGHGHARGEIPHHVQSASRHQTAKRIMSFPERRLRRLARQLQELQCQHTKGHLNLNLYNNS